MALETRSASWLASLDFIGYPSHHPPQSLDSSGKVRFIGAKLVYTGPPDRMPHRKGRETKQQPSNQISCCLVSLHILWHILSSGPVLLLNAILYHAGIPNYDGEVPEREVRAEYPFGYTVKPNDTITSGKRTKLEWFESCHFLTCLSINLDPSMLLNLGLVTYRPHLRWPADKSALYTGM